MEKFADRRITELLDELQLWGGRAWRRLLKEAFHSYIGTDLTGCKVLELGFRDGSMCFLFAKLGANVIRLETDTESVRNAAASAIRFGLAERTTFLSYDGDLDAVSHGAFDLVFTKSVLVLTDLRKILPAIDRKLKHDGRFVFIENGEGSPLMRFARFCVHPSWDFTRFHYFTGERVDLIRHIFDVQKIKYIHVPPVYLICGRKRVVVGST
jgi:SAM-dependent methyltransferase